MITRFEIICNTFKNIDTDTSQTKLMKSESAINSMLYC